MRLCRTPTHWCLATSVLAASSLGSAYGQDLLKPKWIGGGQMKRLEADGSGTLHVYETVTGFMLAKSPETMKVAQNSTYPNLRLLLAPVSEYECHVRLLIERAPPEFEKNWGAKPLLIIGPEKFLRSAERPKRRTTVTFFPQEGAAYRNEVECSSLGQCTSHWFDVGAELTIRGSIEVLGTTIESDGGYPLTFRMTSEGLVLMYGRGKVKPADSQPIVVGEDDEVSTWLSRLGHKKRVFREAAASALGWLGAEPKDSDAVVSGLLHALTDSAWQVKRNAAESLGRLRAKRAVTALEKLLKDESAEGWVAAVAREAIDKINAQ